MPERLCALDVGTTSARALIADLSGTVLAVEKRPLLTSYPTPGRVEQDAAQIWAAVMEARDAALARAGCAPGDLAAIGVTSQRAGVVVFDAATSDPAGAVVVWSDAGDTLRASELGQAGFFAWPQLPSAKLEALLARIDGGRERLASGALKWGPIDSWLVHRLSGGDAHIADFSGAWFTGYLDMARLDAWNERLIAFQGLDPAAFPRLVDSWGALAVTDAKTVGAQVPIAAMIADQQAGLIAHAALATGAWKATLGTSAVVIASLGDSLGGSAEGMIPAALLRAAGAPRFCIEGMVISAGSFIDWLAGSLGLYPSPAELMAAARRGRADTGVAVVPSLQGLGAPHGRLDARALISGLSPDVSGGDVAAAALAGIAFRLREITQAMVSLPGAETRATLPVDGGLSTDDGFVQTLADLVGLPVRRHAVREATALGAAVAAGMGAGLIREADLPRFARYDLECAPGISAGEADARFARWTTARKFLTG